MNGCLTLFKFDYTVCPIHGEFTQSARNHLFGQGCPICKESHLETDIAKALQGANIMFERQKTFDWLKFHRNMFLDFFLPQYNIAIECQGIQHFEPTKHFEENDVLIIDRDIEKSRLCDENNIKLLYIATDKRFNENLSKGIGIYNEHNIFTNIESLINEIIGENIQNEKTIQG